MARKGGKAAEHKRQKQLAKRKANRAKRSVGGATQAMRSELKFVKTLEQVESVFGHDMGEEIFTRALRGESPEEIAEALNLELTKVTRVVEDFLKLDPKFLEKLENAPGLLSKGSEVKAMIHDKIKAAQQQQSARPW